jgi:hypothetical protein
VRGATVAVDAVGGVEGFEVESTTTDFQQAPRYSRFQTTGDTRVPANWPSYPQARAPSVPRNVALDAVGANAANVAKTICSVRGYCGRRGGFQGFVTPWIVLGNVPGNTSSAGLLDRHVEISEGDIMFGVGRPELPANDVIAHEFGHVMDFEYADDRFAGGANQQGREVGEALADLLAYDFDRADATAFELSRTGVARDWANPAAERLGNKPYPAHMDDYDSTPFPDNPPPHFNSTILSHAYYLFVQRVGHHRAGRVLHNVPSLLSPRPTFQEVSGAFHSRAFTIYDSATAGHVTSAFSQVGPEPHRAAIGGSPCRPDVIYNSIDHFDAAVGRAAGAAFRAVGLRIPFDPSARGGRADP